MTIDGFLETFERLREKHKAEFYVTECGRIRTTKIRHIRTLASRDCPLSFVAHKLGKRVHPLSIPQKELRLKGKDATAIFVVADAIKKSPRLRKQLLKAAGCVERASA